MSLRLIFKREIRHISGVVTEEFETVDADIPLIERAITRGGRSETEYDHTTLVGIEVLPPGGNGADDSSQEKTRELSSAPVEKAAGGGSPGSALTLDDPGPEVRTAKKRWLKGAKASRFLEFWKAFDYPKDRARAADSWYDLEASEKVDEALMEKILAGARAEAANRPALLAGGRSAKWGQGWITARRWEDEIHEQPDAHKQGNRNAGTFAAGKTGRYDGVGE